MSKAKLASSLIFSLNSSQISSKIYNPRAIFTSPDRSNLSEAQRQTRIIYQAFCEIAANGADLIRPGDVIELLRSRDHPLGIWHVNGEFARLAVLNLIKLDEDTGKWQLVPDQDFDVAAETVNGNWEQLA